MVFILFLHVVLLSHIPTASFSNSAHYLNAETQDTLILSITSKAAGRITMIRVSNLSGVIIVWTDGHRNTLTD